MSWCDKLASTPSAGFGLDWHFATSDAVLTGLSSILDPLVKNEKPQFNINRNDTFAVNITTQDGFSYGVEPSKIYVGFQHSMKFKPVSGGAPIMEMLSTPLPFTTLLKSISRRLAETTLSVPGHKTRKITRVGIVTTTLLDEDDAPPGIVRFIEYIGRPWGGLVENYSIQITSLISKTPDWTDKCLHQIIRPSDPDELTNITFDWHRTFAQGIGISPDHIRSIWFRAEHDALAYFEELAEGGRFDEQLIDTRKA